MFNFKKIFFKEKEEHNNKYYVFEYIEDDYCDEKGRRPGTFKCLATFSTKKEALSFIEFLLPPNYSKPDESESIWTVAIKPAFKGCDSYLVYEIDKKNKKEDGTFIISC